MSWCDSVKSEELLKADDGDEIEKIRIEGLKMNIFVSKTAVELGRLAAKHTAELLRQSILEKGNARLVLSTGSSQFETLEALMQEDVDWSRVTAFHLDEYVDLSEEHPASFRKYLQTRFLSKIPMGEYHLVDGKVESIPMLTEALLAAPIDVGLIGVGENAHIAFNDPPANFDTKEAYICVNLDDACKQQQVGEGWFRNLEEVPKQAISMTVHQILQCKHIVSAVPHKVKENAVYSMLTQDTNSMVPATILKEHPNFSLFLDAQSAGRIQEAEICGSSNIPSFTFTIEE